VDVFVLAQVEAFGSATTCVVGPGATLPFVAS
jgi:hypothetical protein